MAQRFTIQVDVQETGTEIRHPYRHLVLVGTEREANACADVIVAEARWHYGDLIGVTLTTIDEIAA